MYHEYHLFLPMTVYKHDHSKWPFKKGSITAFFLAVSHGFPTWNPPHGWFFPVALRPSEAMTVAITWIGDGGASHDVEVDAEDVESRPKEMIWKLVVEILDTAISTVDFWRVLVVLIAASWKMMEKKVNGKGMTSLFYEMEDKSHVWNHQRHQPEFKSTSILHCFLVDILRSEAKSFLTGFNMFHLFLNTMN